MKKNKEAQAKQEDNGPAASRRPTHVAYWVRERDDKKGQWHPVGVAWSHADGKGLTLRLDLQPLDGRITLRAVEDRKEDE